MNYENISLEEVETFPNLLATFKEYNEFYNLKRPRYSFSEIIRECVGGPLHYRQQIMQL